MMSIEEKIKQCENHGFKARKEWQWLWLEDTDKRYRTSKNGYIQLDNETKVLMELGFKYSSHRMNYYWDGR